MEEAKEDVESLLQGQQALPEVVKQPVLPKPAVESEETPSSPSDASVYEADDGLGQCCVCGGIGALGNYCTTCEDSGLIYEAGIEEVEEETAEDWNCESDESEW